MAPGMTEAARPIPTHVVVMPYPGRGHINPTINLCRLIASRADQQRLLITFVVTEEWLGFIGSYNKPPNLRFATIPNVLPSELVRGTNMPSFLDAVLTMMEEPFEQLLDRLEPAKLIITDTFLPWAVEIGKRRNIPVASLWTMPASVFSVFYHFDLLVHHGHFPFEVSERGEELVDYIPGISSIRLADLPSIIHMKDQRLLQSALRGFSNVHEAQYILFTSNSEIESQVIDALKQKFSVPLLCLGPLIPHMSLEGDVNASLTFSPNYIQWLNAQPENSVLYVSLGSFLSISSSQMDEIAAGLQDSGVRYLLIARTDALRLGGEHCGRMGMVLPWCDQLKVLSHPSIGGFWTHCGWNSTMEAIFTGVPMLGRPIIMDQFPVSKLVVEDWKIGWRVEREIGGDAFHRDEIAKLVRRFMDLESNERKELTRNSSQLKKICQEAIAKGGSSETNLNYFIYNAAA